MIGPPRHDEVFKLFILTRDNELRYNIDACFTHAKHAPRVLLATLLQLNNLGAPYRVENPIERAVWEHAATEQVKEELALTACEERAQVRKQLQFEACFAHWKRLAATKAKSCDGNAININDGDNKEIKRRVGCSNSR